jgi:hypothetical protein
MNHSLAQFIIDLHCLDSFPYFVTASKQLKSMAKRYMAQMLNLWKCTCHPLQLIIFTCVHISAYQFWCNWGRKVVLMIKLCPLSPSRQVCHSFPYIEDRHFICIVCRIWFNIGPILTYLILNEKITLPKKTNPIICWKCKPWIVAKTLWKTTQKLGYEHANDHCIGLVILHPHMDVPLLMAILNSGYTLAMSPWFTIGYLSTFIGILQG